MFLHYPEGVFTVSVQGQQIGFRRDKDIPSLVTRVSNCLGFAGSDALIEAGADVRQQLEVSPMLRLAARFAIGARMAEASEIAERLKAGESLVIATSNPRQLKAVAADHNMNLRDIVVLGGAVESALDDD
ncbi:MAG: hypothetical protein WA843_02060, partial [Candidatus Saccharimonadales bacterium]